MLHRTEGLSWNLPRIRSASKRNYRVNGKLSKPPPVHRSRSTANLDDREESPRNSAGNRLIRRQIEFRFRPVRTASNRGADNRAGDGRFARNNLAAAFLRLDFHRPIPVDGSATIGRNLGAELPSTRTAHPS